MDIGKFYFLNDQYFIDFPDGYLMKNKEVINCIPHDKPCFYSFKEEFLNKLYRRFKMSINTEGHMTEAEYLSMNVDPTDFDLLLDIIEDQKSRLQSLVDRYIVVCDGQNGEIYLQDRKISKKHYWTMFLSNALSFSIFDDANEEVKKLKYNNPRVMKVDNKLNLRKVSS